MKKYLNFEEEKTSNHANIYNEEKLSKLINLI